MNVAAAGSMAQHQRCNSRFNQVPNSNCLDEFILPAVSCDLSPELRESTLLLVVKVIACKHWLAPGQSAALVKRAIRIDYLDGMTDRPHYAP